MIVSMRIYSSSASEYSGVIWNSEAKIRHPPHIHPSAFQVPLPLFTHLILLHYPGKSPKRPPQMLHQAKVKKRPHTNTPDNKMRRKIRNTEKQTLQYRNFTKYQRTAMRNREKRIPMIKKKQSRKNNRDACYRNQNHISDGSGEPKESVSRKSKNADIARSERGSIYFTSHFQLGSNAENAYIWSVCKQTAS